MGLRYSYGTSFAGARHLRSHPLLSRRLRLPCPRLAPRLRRAGPGRRAARQDEGGRRGRTQAGATGPRRGIHARTHHRGQPDLDAGRRLVRRAPRPLPHHDGGLPAPAGPADPPRTRRAAHPRVDGRCPGSAPQAGRRHPRRGRRPHVPLGALGHVHPGRSPRRPRPQPRALRGPAGRQGQEGPSRVDRAAAAPATRGAHLRRPRGRAGPPGAWSTS